jgi:PAS domain-containing protein
MLWQFAGYSYLRQTELFRAFDYVALGIACLNLDGQVIYANRALAERLGFPHAQLLAQTWAVSSIQKIMRHFTHIGTSL